MPDYNKGDFTQQGVDGFVEGGLHLNEKRCLTAKISTEEDSAGLDSVEINIHDHLNDLDYTITGENLEVGENALPSGNIEITENGENINVAPYATATVNVSGGGETKWTTVATEQTGTTVYNSGVNLYFLQLSDVTDFGSPVIKVTHDNNVYYCYWDIDNACWHDAMGTIVVAATIFGGVAYWGVAKSADTEVTTHTAKIEADTSYCILYDKTSTGNCWFITTDVGSTIPTPRNMVAQYGCSISTYMGTQVVTFNKAYAVVNDAIS